MNTHQNIKDSLATLTAEIDAILSSDISKENAQLKQSLEAITAHNQTLTADLTAAKTSLAELQNAFYQQVYNEKISILNNIEKRAKLFFENAMDKQCAPLDKVKEKVNHDVNRMKNAMEKYQIENTALLEKLDAIKAEAAQLVLAAKTEAQQTYQENQKFITDTLNTAKEEKLSDEVMATVGIRNNLEAFVGGNLINKVGVLFIILGIITVSRFAVIGMPNEMRALLMLLFSGAFIVAGELFTFDAKGKIPFALRGGYDNPSIFSLGLTSVGVAGLYATLIVSYFVFGILAMIPALVVCIIITIGVFLLSTRYNSQTVATFALIGGYIPAISISGNSTLLYSAMVYFLILNMFVFVLAFYKKWRITMFAGFVLNIATTWWMIYHVEQLWQQYGGPWPVITLGYIMLVFAIYTTVPVISGIKTKIPFTDMDAILIALNTLVSAMGVYYALWVFDLRAYEGIMAIVFAITYLSLGWGIGHFIKTDKYVTHLFYLAGLVFVILAVPLQLGMMWASLGWLVLSVVFGTYGILAPRKKLELFGYVTGILAVMAFVSIDLQNHPFYGVETLIRYSSITAGSLVILAAQAYKGRFGVEIINMAKFAILVNAWAYSIFVLGFIDANTTLFEGATAAYFLYRGYVGITLLFGLAVPRLPYIRSKGVDILGHLIAGGGVIALFSLTDNSSLPSPTIAMIIATCSLTALAIYAVYRLMVTLVATSKTLNPAYMERPPLVVSGYALVMVVLNLVAQFHIPFTSIAISIVIVVAAFLWIIFGFVKRYVLMRRFGLLLSVAAVAKLFLLDLPGLTDGYRIVSYFAFGATLLAISFVYQYFSRIFKLNIKTEKDDAHE